MSPPQLDADLQVAIDAAIAGSGLALEFRDHALVAERKLDGTVVTAADLAVEALLRSMLGAVRLHDAVLGEEQGTTGDGERRWILDPIDGTANFVAGRADWGVHVALEVADKIVLGVVTRPLDGLIWWAARGLGAHRAPLAAPHDSAPLQVSTTADLDSCRVTCWQQGDTCAFGRLTALPGWRAPVDLDDGLRVVAGELDVLAERSGARIWDRAPYLILVEEAGGRFRDLDGGRDPDTNGCTLTNGLLGDQLDLLLAEPPA